MVFGSSPGKLPSGDFFSAGFLGRIDDNKVHDPLMDVNTRLIALVAQLDRAAVSLGAHTLGSLNKPQVTGSNPVEGTARLA
jgi:hypothetical protein